MKTWIRLTIVALGVIGFCSLNRAALAEDERADLLLVLASDVSRSVDDRKFKLQREGYANAIVIHVSCGP